MVWGWIDANAHLRDVDDLEDVAFTWYRRPTRVRGRGGFGVVDAIALADVCAWLTMIGPSNRGNPHRPFMTMRVRGRGGFGVIDAISSADACTWLTMIAPSNQGNLSHDA
jgi:hypothetical protein